MWIDTRECVPLADGEYMVQTAYGRITSMNYTHDAGWNTHYDADGVLCDDNAMPNLYVVRWHTLSTPKSVPQEWLEEYQKSEGVIM